MKAMFRCAVAAALVAASAALWAAEAPSFKPIAPPDSNPLRYDELMRQLSTRLVPTFRMRRAGIFIVASDIQDEKQLDYFVNHTLLKSASAMWNMYFDRKPDYPIYVYLLATMQSYNRFCRQYFGRHRGTPYGFYVAENRALVMNLQPATARSRTN